LSLHLALLSNRLILTLSGCGLPFFGFLFLLALGLALSPCCFSGLVLALGLSCGATGNRLAFGLPLFNCLLLLALRHGGAPIRLLRALLLRTGLLLRLLAVLCGLGLTFPFALCLFAAGLRLTLRL